MKISMYEASVPQFVRGLDNLADILRKADAYASAQGFDSTAFLPSRLYPDMYPLSGQVQRATQIAGGCAARLIGDEVVRATDDETKIADLIARIGRTVNYLKGLQEAAFTDCEERNIVLVNGANTYRMSGITYLLGLAIPNFYFHVTTAYDILRHCGVRLVKQDYIGKI